MTRELLSPPHSMYLIEAGEYSDDPLYQMAREIVSGKAWHNHEIRDLLEEFVPAFKDVPDEKRWPVLRRVQSANGIAPVVKAYFDEKKKKLPPLSPEQSISLTALFLDKPELFLERIHYSERELLIATSLLGVQEAASFFKQAETEEIKQTFSDYLFYFALIHDLMVGAKTNVSFFTYHPESCDLSFIEESCITTSIQLGDNFTRVRTALMFEGHRIIRVKLPNGEEQFFVDLPINS